MAEEAVSVPVVAITAAVGAVVLLLILLCGIGKKEDEPKNESEQSKTSTNTKKNGNKTQGSKKRETKQVTKKKEAKVTFTHPWLSCSLKMHSAPILDMDFSANGKYLASCAEDRTVYIWSVKELDKKEHKSHRANVELDHATQVKFSPDSKAFIVSLFSANTVRVMKMGKKADGSPGNVQTAFDFNKGHDAELINIGMASNGRFIMTCSKDTCIKIWDLKGEVLAVIDTHQMNNSYGAVSPCGRFVGSSGFTPDVKVWEVCFDKSGNFREVIRAFELKGHSAGVYSFAFSSDSHRMATVSKDGTWKLWDTNVEYAKQQDPYLLKTGKHDSNGHHSCIALSPDGRTVAIATGVNISIYSTLTAQCEEVIEDVHTCPISCLMFDPSSHFLLSTGDKNIHVLRNIVGYKVSLEELQQKEKSAGTQALRERLQQQISQYRQLLSSVENGST